MCRRFVAQFSVVTGDAELFDQAKRGKQFRFSENGFGENFLVEKIEAPGPEPDQVDQENRERDYRHRNNSKEPLQNAFKHAIDMEPLNLRRCKIISLLSHSLSLPLADELDGGKSFVFIT